MKKAKKTSKKSTEGKIEKKQGWEANKASKVNYAKQSKAKSKQTEKNTIKSMANIDVIFPTKF